MERALSETPEPRVQLVKVVLESVVSVPTNHAEMLVSAFRRAGIDAWDTGERTTTEEGLGAMTDLRVRVEAV